MRRLVRVGPGLGVSLVRKWGLEAKRWRNIKIAFRFIAVALTCLVFSGVAAAQAVPVTDPQGFHILLRLESGKTTYKLGEPIFLEVSCFSDRPQQFISFCGDDAHGPNVAAGVVGLDAKAKVALDRVETNWIGMALCPAAQYEIDNLIGDPIGKGLLDVNVEGRWMKLTLSDHYPMSAGRFRINVSTEGALLPRGSLFFATSMPVEINVVDDPQWRAATLREAIETVKNLDPSAPDSARNAAYEKVQYMPDREAMHWLISEKGYLSPWETYPDRAAAAKFLREYLEANSGDIYLKEPVEAVLALELAADSPGLYERAVALQGALGEPSRRDLRDLRAWLLPHYRQLMLELARSMVTNHKQDPSRDEENSLEDKAEGLIKINVPECFGTPNFLSERELQQDMQEAGLSSEFITAQLAGMRKARLNLGPYTKYQRRAAGFWRVIETPPPGVSVKWLVIGLGQSATRMTLRWPDGLGCQNEDAEILGDTITATDGGLRAAIQIRGPDEATLRIDGVQTILHLRKTKEATNFACE
jgi:hypothetical protein